jgi:tetratricopeptide (TPR) repeat protein
MDETPKVNKPIATLNSNVLQWFVDREGSLHRFRDMLAGQDPALVLVIEGPSGIGKTWLLIRLHQEAAEKTIPVSNTDFASGEAFDDLLMVHRIALALGSHHFVTLNRELEKATELKVVLKIESGPGSGGVTIHGDAEIHGDVAGRDIIKDNTFNLATGDPRTHTIWQERINQAFFTDLRQLGSTQGVALLFDSYEQATHEARLWINGRLLKRIGEGSLPGVWVALAGDQVPSFPTAWHGLVAELHLDPLPAAEVRAYLTDRRELIISEETIANIYEITGGRPDLVALIAESNPKTLPEEPDKDQLLKILTEGILEYAQAPIPETLRVAAIPHWFDAALLVDLLGTTAGVDDRLADLQVYTFVQADERGHLRFARAVRRVLIREWKQRPTEFRELNTRAAHHFDERAGQAEDPKVREELERQAVGHWLVIDERAGRDRLRTSFEKNEDRYWLADCELLLQRAEAVEDLSDLTQNWLRYLQGRLALARNDYESSRQEFDALLAKTDPGSELHALAGWSRGQVAAEQGEWADAIDRYENSLKYFQAQGDPVRVGQVMLALGDVHLQQARALGEPIHPRLLRPGGWWRFVTAIPAFIVALPFVIYARAIRRWRLPPLHHGMNYRNWTLVRLLLTAARWYEEAESVFAKAKEEALPSVAQQRLAETYHRLGWWHAARDLFDRVLHSKSVVNNPYREAQLKKEMAETDLLSGNVDKAIEQLEESRTVFARLEDVQGQAQAQALLGQARLQKGEFEDGLTLFRVCLDGFSSAGDRLGIGLALNALWRWLQRADPTPEQADAIEQLIASREEKTYLPRVPDRLAAVMEFVVSLGLILLGVALLVGLAIPVPLTPMRETWANLLSIDTWLGTLGRIVLLAWLFSLGSAFLGLLLILWGARQKMEPERLDRIVTSDQAIRRYNYRNQVVTRIPWREVQAILSVDRVLWRRPIPLLSEFCLFGAEAAIRVPATMLWYETLKGDIEHHLRQHGVPLTWRRLDVHVLRSRLGLCFLLFPVLLGLGSLIVWNLVELPLSTQMAAFIGPSLIFLSVMAMVMIPCWWLVVYPLWVHHTLKPRSRTPLVIGGLGLIIVAFAFYFDYQRPYFPIRHWLDGTVQTLGFVLIFIAPLWVLTAVEAKHHPVTRTGVARPPWIPEVVSIILLGAVLLTALVARQVGPYAHMVPMVAHISAPLWVLAAFEWKQRPITRSKAVYPAWARGVAAIFLLGVVLLTGLFAQRAGAYAYILPMVTRFSHGDYQGTIDRCTYALEVSDGSLADVYYFRALAYDEIGEHQLAVDDLSHLINSPGPTMTKYRWFRAKAYQGLSNLEDACADVRSALDARRWGLSRTYRQEAEQAWKDWKCDQPKKITQDSQALSSRGGEEVINESVRR